MHKLVRLTTYLVKLAEERRVVRLTDRLDIGKQTNKRTKGPGSLT